MGGGGDYIRIGEGVGVIGHLPPVRTIFSAQDTPFSRQHIPPPNRLYLSPVSTSFDKPESTCEDMKINRTLSFTQNILLLRRIIELRNTVI